MSGGAAWNVYTTLQCYQVINGPHINEFGLQLNPKLVNGYRELITEEDFAGNYRGIYVLPENTVLINFVDSPESILADCPKLPTPGATIHWEPVPMQAGGNRRRRRRHTRRLSNGKVLNPKTGRCVTRRKLRSALAPPALVTGSCAKRDGVIGVN